ncbi:MAG: hypothetical protein GOMPHAMPRED_003208 [Gomphillus americanus]|uniref:Uncharacterized protein n=1 Tax=Gomphillus americanus TaxID=1940652 RepID=A0A8H3I5H2_9LECA|nr:MAG: hypothetical protein GOMPHAMPRED_003208 [Gomphillus americanus]
MASLTNHLIRRGVEGLQTSFRDSGDGSKVQFRFSALSATVVIVTVLLFAVGQFAIQYTYGELIATLAAVEAPSSTAIIRTPAAESEDSEHPDAPLLSSNEKTDVREPQDQEILLIKQRALTSRFCAIKRHLRARGGRGSRFRGLPIYLLNGFLLSALMGLASAFVRPESVAFTLLEIGAYTLLTPFELLWNHTIISEPSQRMQGFAPRSIIKKALFPTLLYSCISLSAQGFIHGCLKLRINPTNAVPNQPTEQKMPLALLALVLIGIFLFIAVQIPAEIAIARVRASLLSAEQVPIIPFDRTFNGQVISTEQGGSGMLDLWQAWVGCDMQTRLRVLGVLCKVVAMHLSWMLFGALVLLGELRFFLGPEFINMMSLDFVLRT